VPRVNQRAAPLEGMTEMDTDLWTYNESLDRPKTLDDFGVVALDGDIGKIDEASYDVGASYLVVDTGPWIFGRKVLIPARAVARLDIPDEKVYLRLTKDQIKDSPEFDASSDPSARRDAVGAYYGSIF
jgi:hypothetical protein